MQALAKINLRTNQIHVDIGRLWEQTQTENKFIQQFSTMVNHEHTHEALTPVYKSLRISDKDRVTKYLLGEEVAVRICHKQGFAKNELYNYIAIKLKNEKTLNKKRSKRVAKRV